jgi:uncharacterized LabA/DUF88 family protein
MRLVLIDGSNLYEGARSARITIDYARLLDLLNEDGDLLRAYYFTALMDKSIESNVRKTVDWLSHNGYICVTKEAKEYPVVENYIDESGHVRSRTIKKLKGNVDIEIASYAFIQSARLKLSELWLFSGDGDFTLMVKELQEQYAMKVYVVSAIGMVSNDLRRQADKFINLTDIADDIRRIG